MMASTMSGGAIARIGAKPNMNRFALGGMKSSLNIIFSASATKCRIPQARQLPRLARLGPSRSCIIADWRRSNQVSKLANPRANTMTNTNILMRAAAMPKPGWPYAKNCAPDIALAP